MKSVEDNAPAAPVWLLFSGAAAMILTLYLIFA